MSWILGGFFLLVTMGFAYQILWERKMARKGHCGMPWVDASGFASAFDGSVDTRCQVCGGQGPTFSWYLGHIERGQ